jgi:pyruvyltransferase
MNKKLNIFYWKLKTNNGNFGDELNPYIISHLSACEVNQIIIPLSGFKYIMSSLRGIYHGQFSIREIPVLIKQFFINDFIVSIGSILSLIDCSTCNVWGTGIISNEDIIKPAIFHAVRGKYTQNRLHKLNLPIPDVIGDPALILPLIYKSEVPKKYKLGIIPHFSHFNFCREIFNDDEIFIIDLTESVEFVIDQINSCEYTISTSLHGLIVSHVYKIKSLWFVYNEKPLTGFDVKFFDYFSSVNIPEYKPFDLYTLKGKSTKDIIDLIISNDNINTINVDIEIVQKKLINVAPFTINQKYILN